MPAYPERTRPALTSPGGVCSVSVHLPGHRVSEDGGRGPHPPHRLLRPEAMVHGQAAPTQGKCCVPPSPPGSYSRHPSQQLPGVVPSHGTVCIPRCFFAPSCCQRSRASLRPAGEGLGSAPGLLLQRGSPEDQHGAAGGKGKLPTAFASGRERPSVYRLCLYIRGESKTEKLARCPRAHPRDTRAALVSSRGPCRVPWA